MSSYWIPQHFNVDVADDCQLLKVIGMRDISAVH